MATQTPNIVITEIDSITAFDAQTGDYCWSIDEVQQGSIQQEETLREIMGRTGKHYQVLHQDKSVRLMATNGYISSDMMASQLGTTAVNKVTKVAWADFIEVQNHRAYTSCIAHGTLGAEIQSVFIRNKNGTLGKELHQAAVPSDGYFSYDPTTKELLFGNDVPDFSIVVAYYQRQIRADVIVSSVTNNTEALSLYVDAVAQDACSNIYHVQIYFPKAKLSGRVTLELGGDQTVHAFEAEALPGNCGAKGDLWTYTLFGGASSQDPDTPLILGVGRLDINSLG